MKETFQHRGVRITVKHVIKPEVQGMGTCKACAFKHGSELCGEAPTCSKEVGNGYFKVTKVVSA